MAKNALGRFPECGKWQKIRRDDFLSAGNGKKYVGTISRVWEMTKNAWGRFLECGKWQKMRGDDFPSAGNGKKYI